jgi:hypothetical protein
MPLVSTGSSMALTLIPAPYAVSFWMAVDGSHEADHVRIVVTGHCVGGLDPSRFCDQRSAVDIARANRRRIEDAASAKFDAEGTDPGTWDGKPILLIQSHDILD